jgi:ferredoxin
VTYTAVGLGMPRVNIRYELFSPAGPAACDHAFEVLLARSHTRVQVSADETILDAVLAAGVAAEFGCRAGQCGACAVTALEGDVDHRDTTLSDDERIVGRRACICVSRAKGARLVLDL